MVLDQQTLAAVQVLVLTILSGALLSVSISHKKFHGTVYWALGNISLTVAVFLMFAGDRAGSMVIAVAAPVISIIGACLISHGTSMFLGKRSHKRLYVITLFFVLLALIYVDIFMTGKEITGIIFSAIFSAILFDIAAAIFLGPPTKLVSVYRATGIVFFVVSLFFFTRASILFLSPYVPFPFVDTLLTPLTYLVGICGPVGWTFGLILMTTSRLERDLERQATHDPLTGAQNRRKFFEESKRVLAMARRYKRPFSLFIFDIDHFKKINDTYGHKVGDEVLKTITKYCQNQVREGDVFARIGGEEFVLLLPETSYDQAVIVAERLRKGIAGIVHKVGAESVKVTCSFGVTEFNKTDGYMDSIIARADKALYDAKESGRNRVKGDNGLTIISASVDPPLP